MSARALEHVGLFWCEELDLLLAGTVDQVTAGALPFRVLPGLVRELARHELDP